MRNKIILGFVTLFIILLTNNASSQDLDLGCCTIYEHEGTRFYCGLVSSEECIGDIIAPSCGSINRFDDNADACDIVSCQNPTSGFSGNVKRIQCLSTPGSEIVTNTPISTGSRISSSLERGGCIVDGECYEYTTRRRCEEIGRNRDVVFDISIHSESQCQGWTEATHFSELGCCVESNSCSRTFSDRCDSNFRSGVRCDAIPQCSCGPITKSCGEGGLSVIERNNCGVENIRRLGENQRCREVGDEIEEFSTNCVEGEGSVTEIELLRGININEKEVIINSDLLGGTDIRRDGDIWCYDTGEGTDPGDSHYVLSCRQGSVVISKPCGTFRDNVCTTEKGYPDCVNNKWEQCMTCGQSGSWDNFGTDCGENECLNLGLEADLRDLSNSEKTRLSHCFFDTNGKNECWPKYPPGFEFWSSYDEATVNKVSGEGGWRCDGEHNTLGCGEGGDKRLNQCDPNECRALGDCTYEPGHPYLGATGGVVLYGGAAYIGVKYYSVVPKGIQQVIPYFGGKKMVEEIGPMLV